MATIRFMDATVLVIYHGDRVLAIYVCAVKYPPQLKLLLYNVS